ncbi:hypothetical protein JW935_17230 [candidate division KSB1 bacterium]|nr:hypothetical protein [candidate division KSB1 bacterium]
MNNVLFVLTHHTGMSQFGYGDALLHTPIFRWLRKVLGGVDAGCLPEITWILERCSAVDTIIPVRSLAEARRLSEGRIILHSDFSVDEYPYDESGLSYTQIMAQRIGIPGTELVNEPLDYVPTTKDRVEMNAVLSSIGADRRAIITVNARGRTRKENPGLLPGEYVGLAERLSVETGAMVLFGDYDVGENAGNLVSVQVSLPVWSALIEHSMLWMGECTGPYHFACALKTPTAMFSAYGMENFAWLASEAGNIQHLLFEGLSGDRYKQEKCIQKLLRI